MSMMKGFSNAFRIPELRKKILVTLGLVFVCRLVSQVPTPGVDWRALQQVIETARQSTSGGGLLDWFDVFTGGALGQCAIGFLSIWPYISAQIVIQLLSSVIPSLEKLKKEGESGRQQLAQITRWLTIVLCVVQSWGIATMLSHPGALGQAFAGVEIVVNPGLGFQLMTVIGMTSAALFVMWLADQITTFGIGNGASLIIMINITSRLPQALISAWERYFGLAGVQASAPIAELPILIIFFLLVVMGTVMLVQGVRKVPIHSTRRSVSGGNTYGMQQTFMPLRVNYTGVMPIIFAQPLIQIPSAMLMKISDATSAGFSGKLYRFAEALANPTVLHMVVYAVLIMFFAFFWVATQFNAVDISENLKKDGSYVPGIRPGRATAEYLDDVMTKITLIGGTGLLLVALVPMLLMGWIQVPWVIASFFGGTSLLIIVGVALDTLRIMESHLLVRKYDGFLAHGSLRGRGGM
ncbi:MAG: preprotein translocase subunit SecY [Kiritimatiellae bacterium]|nr:preprotein translocase subunit SecY [Kiritimatiellia bacterium]